MGQVFQPLALEYAGRSQRWRVPWRRLAIVVALLITIPPLSHKAIQIYRTLQARSAADRQLRAYFRQCLAHTQSDATPLFDETRDTCPILLDPAPGGSSRNWRYIRVRGDPGVSYWDAMPRGSHHAVPLASMMMWTLGELDVKTTTGRFGIGLNHLFFFPYVQQSDWCDEPETYELFIHGRSAPGCPERLVGVTFDASTFLAGDPTPIRVVVDSPPRSMLRGFIGQGMRVGLGFPCAATEPLRLFAGQADRLDSSHFTIRYSAGKRHGVIDGWVRSDDSVTLWAHDAQP